MIRVIWADELREGQTLLIACKGEECRVQVDHDVDDTRPDHQLAIRRLRPDGPYVKIIATEGKQEVGWGERASEPVRIRECPPVLAISAGEERPKPGPRPGPAVGR